MPYIPGEGPKTAAMAIVAEKPSNHEVIAGRPLVGPSGQQLNSILTNIGLRRSDVYVTNAVKNVTTIANPTHEEIAIELPLLYKELSALPNLNCLVPLGESALLALSNFQLSGISSLRGSVIPSFLGPKMVPTFHPAFYMRGKWEYRSVVQFDLDRAKVESTFPEIVRPQRSYYYDPHHIQTVLEWVKDLTKIAKHTTQMAFDIELHRNGVINCISFAPMPSVAYCFPLRHTDGRPYWSVMDECIMWRLINTILNQPKITYISQNGLFDTWHLWRHGINIPEMSHGFDTMYAHQLLYPDFPHSLAYLTSIFTNEPYYKDETGIWNKTKMPADDRFWIYNCKDSAVTIECKLAIEAELKEEQLFDVYTHEVHKLWEPLLSMRKKGIHVSRTALQEVRQEIATTIAKHETAIEARIGFKLNTRSPLDMAKLYTTLNIKPRLTPSGRVKTDAEEIMYMAHKYPEQREILLMIHNLNTNRTLRDGFLGISLDPYDFYHPYYIPHKTKTGRLASKGSDNGGPQLQNIPARLRKVFIPDDPSHEFTSCDLKQAEAMIVAWMAEDEILINAFLNEKDVHRVNACILFRNWVNPKELPPDSMLDSIRENCDACEKLGIHKCNHSERYIAKQTGHASSYLVGPRRFCSEQIKKGLSFSEADAKKYLSLLVSDAKRRWHADVERQLKSTRILTTPLGKRRTFFGIPDHDMLREGLSWLAQATVAQITTRAMILFNDRYRESPEQARIVTQTHDSLLISHNRDLRAEVMLALNLAFYIPLTIKGRELIIPLEFQFGENWGEV
jgi:uracil-DNA glycosylase family 4